MIRYALKCSEGHSFDSWFQSADAYEALAGRGLVACAICGGTDVAKSMMAPGVASRKEAVAEVAAPAPAEPQPMAAGPLSAPGTEVERALVELRRKVEASSTYVGKSFAREARDMYLGDAPERQIHGEATAEEARSLIEDGVPVLPLPGIARSKAN